jgi:hypothetical protein
MWFKEVIAVYTENHTKPKNTKRKNYWLLSRWDIYFQLGYRGLTWFEITRTILEVPTRV